MKMIRQFPRLPLCRVFFSALAVSLLLLCAACEKKPETITFTAEIESIGERSVLVRTVDYDGFDRASVGFAKELELPFELLVGQAIVVTILPEIRESYPVQVTAVKIELSAAP